MILEPPPRPDTVVVGADLGPARTILGWTSVHNEQRGPKTRAILDKCAHANNVHFLGFGTNIDPQPGPAAPYDWRGLDATFGRTAGEGYFPPRPMVLTLCGCPPHMRVPKPGFPPDPIGLPTGAALTSLFDYSFPHSSWFEECSDLWAAAAERYPQLIALQFWNEGKGCYFGNAEPGSKLVQPSWGIPPRTGSNRWWSEGITALSNMTYRKVKLKRPDIIVAAPYQVINSYDTHNVADHADGPMPYEWNGPWGHGDRKVLDHFMYFLNYGLTDVLAIDAKTSNKGDEITLDNQWRGGQKIVDFAAWLRKLAVFDPVRYARPGCNAAELADRLWCAEWYARGRTVDLTHAEEAATIAANYIEYSLKAGVRAVMMWAPQGHGVDPADSHPLALWTDVTLDETELVPVCAGLVEHFAPGTPLRQVTAEDPSIVGVASPTMLCLVSRSPDPIDVVVDHNPLTLAPYEVRFIARAT